MSEDDWKARVQRNKAERLRRLAGHHRLVISVSSLLFEADLMGIESEPDEYDMEAEIISIRLLEGLTEAALPSAVHETLSRALTPWLQGPPSGTRGWRLGSGRPGEPIGRRLRNRSVSLGEAPTECWHPVRNDAPSMEHEPDNRPTVRRWVASQSE